ncbi:MAG: hypothetical protein AAGD13_12515 [Pseudomonadota bacterium]
MLMKLALMPLFVAPLVLKKKVVCTAVMGSVALAGLGALAVGSAVLASRQQRRAPNPGGPEVPEPTEAPS